MTPQDFLAWRNLTDARISPDGRKVVYVVQEYDREADKSKNSLWLIRLDGDRTPRRLTSSPHDGSPRWAPDSRRVAFTSGREQDKGQLYVIDIDGGEAQQLKTDVSPSGAPRWSPDGSKIAFLAMVDRKLAATPYPGAPTESPEPTPTDAGKPTDADKQFAEGIKVITEFEYRADRKGFTYHKRPQLCVLDIASGLCSQLTETDEPLAEAVVWNPSGSTLIYGERRFSLPAAKYSTAVHEISVASKADSLLFTFDGQVDDLVMAPDASALYFTATSNASPLGVALSLIHRAELAGQALSLAPTALTCLTPTLDRSCGQLAISGSGEELLFTVENAGTVQPRRLTLAGLDFAPLSTGLPATTTVLDVASTGAAVAVANNAVTPPQAYLLTDGAATCLTTVNADLLAKFPACPAEKFSYAGADGWTIEGWLVRPLDYQAGRRYATVLSIHGGPTGAYGDSWQLMFQLLAHQGFAVVLTNPRGSVGYGESFTRGCIADWGGKDYQDIMAGVDHVIAMGVADPNRLGVMGWSYGGYMTCWTVTQTDRFKAAVGGANISNIYTLYGCSDIGAAYDEALLGDAAFDNEELYMQRSAMRHVRNVKTPILLLHGEADVRCPIDQSEQFFTALKRLGKEAVFVRYPGQYHGFTRPSFISDRWNRTVAWFKHHLMA